MSDTNTPAVTAKKKATRLVTMNNGSVVDFGEKSNRRSTIDLESNSLTFFVYTGEIISQSFNDLPAFAGLSELSEFLRRIILDGIRAKVNASLGLCPLQGEVDTTIEVDGEQIVKKVMKNVLADTIQEVLHSIASGVYSIRGLADEPTVPTFPKSLKVAQLAYAMTVIALPQMFKETQGTMEWTNENLGEQDVIRDIAHAWNTKTKGERNAIRKSVPFKKFKTDLEFEMTKAAPTNEDGLL